MTGRSDRRDLHRLWPFVRPHRRGFLVALTILAASFVVELAGPWIVRAAIDGPLTERGPGAARELLWFVAGLAACVVVSSLLGHRYTLVTAQAGQGVVRDLRDRLFAHLLRLDPRWHDRQPTGRVVTRVTTDVENLDQLVTTGALQSLFDLLRMFGLAAALFTVDVALASFLTLSIPAVAGISLAFRRQARRAYGAVRGELADQNGRFAEFVDGMRTLCTYGAEAFAIDTHRAHTARTEAAWRRTVVCYAGFFAAVDASLRVAQAGLLLVGGLRALDGVGSAGSVVQAWLYFQLLSGPIRDLGERYNVVQAALASLERILDVLDLPATPPTARAPVAAGPAGPLRVRFESVSFGYQPDRPVLHEVDIEVPAGSTCAIVGPTGAGKTTLLALAGRLHDPDRGRVLIGDQPLTRIDPATLAPRVALVVQEPVLLPGTLLDNLRWLAPSASPQRVTALLEELGATGLLRGRPDGLERPVGEGGRGFSRGERQLIAFARALLLEPDLLLLDEATASVDLVAEGALRATLARLRADRTCLIVAHRLATVRGADQVLVVDGGRIVERGHPSVLARQDSRFAAMLAIA